MSVLGIDAVKARHRGNYTCFAQNKAGVANHTVYLAINGLNFLNNIFQFFPGYILQNFAILSTK